MSPHLRKTARRRRPRHGRPPLRPGRDRARPHRDPRHRGRRRGAAAGVRPGRAHLVLRGRRRRAVAAARRAVRRPAGAAACSAPRSTAFDPGDARPCCSTDGEVLAYDELVLATGAAPFVPPVPGPRPAGLLRLPDHRGPRGDPRGGGDGAPRRRRDRRRAARAGGRQRAAPARPRDPRGRDGAAADGGAGRRRRRRDPAPAHRGARPHRAHRRDDRARCSGDGRVDRAGAQGRATRSTREVVVFSAGIRPARRARPGRRARPRRARRRARRRAVPHLRPARLGDRRVRGARAAGCTAWSPPATRWPRSSSTRCSAGRAPSPAPTCPPSSSCSASTSRRFGDAHAHHRGRARAGLRRRRRRASTRSWSSPRTARSCSAASWSATRRRTACSGRWSPRGIELPDNPEDLILPAGRGGAEIGLPDEAVVCSCNNVTKARDRRRGRRRRLRRPACVTACTKAGSTCGSCKPVVKKIVEDYFAAQGKVVDRSLCEHFPLTRQELFDVVAVHGYTPLRRDRRGARHRPRLRHLQARGRLDPGQPAQRARARGRHPHPPGHQRRLPRQHPAQRHLLRRPAHPRRRDHPREADRDRRGGPRLRALHEDHRRPADRPVRRPDGAAARDLAAGWSTPASSPATPTASRCGR